MKLLRRWWQVVTNLSIINGQDALLLQRQRDGSWWHITRIGVKRIFFTARCYACAVLAMGLCLSVFVSVCLSVCLSQFGVLLKRLNTGSHKKQTR